MRRKAVALVISLSLAATLGGCGSKEKPYEKYVAAQETLAQAEGIKFETEGSVKVGISGLTITMDLDMDGAVKKVEDSDDMDMAMEMEMGIMGQNLEMDFWYNDGYYYMDTMGEKVKYPMETGDMQDKLESQLGMLELSEDDFKSIEAQKDGDTTKLIYIMDGDKMQSMIDLIMGLVNQQTSADNMEFSLEEVKGTLVVDKDNRPLSNELSMQMQMTADGQQVDMDMDMDITYQEIGKDVEVTFPDFSQFSESEDPAVA